MNELLALNALQDRADYERHVPRPAVSPAGAQALEVWNAMGGELRTTELPWLVEHFDVPDSHELLELLFVIRSTLKSMNK